MLSTYNREDSSQNVPSYSPSLHRTKENKTNYFTKGGNGDYIYPNNIIINSLNISDGLKELLIKYIYTLEELSSMLFSRLAVFLGIDQYVATIICSAARKLSNCSYRI
jgi:hypothetical protein